AGMGEFVSKLPVPTAKEAWILAARKAFRPEDRFWCAICDGYDDITHAHHVLPLSRQFDIGLVEPEQTHVWLCPNHHILVHIYLSRGEVKNLQLGCEKDWEPETEKGWERKGVIRIANLAAQRERELLAGVAA